MEFQDLRNDWVNRPQLFPVNVQQTDARQIINPRKQVLGGDASRNAPVLAVIA
jgi:hypothetical protein